MKAIKPIAYSLVAASVIAICAAFRSNESVSNYEYKVIGPQSHSSFGLNEAGKEGWELISVTREQGVYTFFLKRRISEKN